MDFSKLDSNEKLAVYGAVASIVGPILASMGFGFGVGWFTLILAIAMLAIIFLPQISPQTNLPGSKGSLMVVVGLVAGVSAFLALIGSIGLLGFFGTNIVFVLGWLIGIAGGLIMGWAGWRAFQAEGGKLQFGSTPDSSSAASPAATPPPAAAPPAEPAATAPPAQPPAAAAPPTAPSPAAAPPAAPPPAAPADSGMSSPNGPTGSDEQNQA